MNARAKTDANSAASLTLRMKEAFIAMGMKKLETKRFCVSVAKNGGKQPLDIHGEVPKEYQKVETVTSDDKDKIREALDAGTELDFAKLEARGTRLSIR